MLPRRVADEIIGFTWDGALLAKVSLTGLVGGVVEYVCDERLRPVGTRVNGTATPARSYDAEGNVSAVGPLTVHRDAASGFVTSVGAGQVTEGYRYNEYGETAAHSVSVGGRAVLETAYARDALGRVTRRTDTVSGTTQTRDYRYDTAGRLTAVTVDGAETGSWTYDAASNRRVAGREAATRYDAQDRLLADDAAVYTYAADGTYRLVTDALGSPLLVVNVDTGLVAQQLSYDEWGNVTSDSNPGFLPFGFAGGHYDRDTRLVRFGKRDYDAATGRGTRSPWDRTGAE
jgi:YD repeat-containing protein